MKFEYRKLFPISWYRWNKGYDFNTFLFFIDILIWTTPLSLLITLILDGL